MRQRSGCLEELKEFQAGVKSSALECAALAASLLITSFLYRCIEVSEVDTWRVKLGT